MQEKWDKKWSVRPQTDQDRQRQVRACLPCLLHSSGISHALEVEKNLQTWVLQLIMRCPS